MLKMPYEFDLNHDLKTPERIIMQYRDAVETMKSLRGILHDEINGVRRNNGKVLSAKDIDGEETHNALLEIKKHFDKIDNQ